MPDPLESLAPLLAASPAAWVQALYLLASCLVISITIAPAAERKLLLNYGPRRAHSPPAPTSADDASGRPPGQLRARGEDALFRAVRELTSMGQIPHSWFFTYYAIYLACACFWAFQYVRPGNTLLQSLATWQVEAAVGSPGMAGGQVAMVWLMMQLQAWRRLYECFAVMKPSRSTMWFVHWVMGLAFYLGVSVAIWIEGSWAVLEGHLQVTSLTADAKAKAAVALPLFLYGWVMQHRCHRNLACLKKYSLPDLGLFRHLVCPHYTCECLIYLSLAVVTAPKGYCFNRTILCVLAFVAVNLGVTAHGTRSWYVEKFGPERVVAKWVMIPWLY